MMTRGPPWLLGPDDAALSQPASHRAAMAHDHNLAQLRGKNADENNSSAVRLLFVWSPNSPMRFRGDAQRTS